MNRNINEQIRSLLQEQKRTQKELASFIGVSQNTVSSWIQQKKYPSIPSIYAICTFFNISYDYLFTGKKTPPIKEDEKELLHHYQTLDNRGKHQVQLKIYDEMERLEREKFRDWENDVGDIRLSLNGKILCISSFNQTLSSISTSS